MGYLLGILNAIAMSADHRSIKRVSKFPTSWINVIRLGSSSIVLAILTTVFAAWSMPSNYVWMLIAVSLVVEFLVTACYVRAFQLSDQSLVGPLFGLTIVFLVPLGIVFLDEVPSHLALFGILFTIVGTIRLGWHGKHSNVIQVVKDLFHEKGALYMLGAVLLGSIAIILAKAGINSYNPLSFGFAIMFGLFLMNFIYAFTKARNERPSWKNIKRISWAGLFFSFGQVFHYVGISLVFVAFYIAFKRFNMVFDVLVGVFVGKEENFIPKIQGAAIMLLGVVLILLG